MPVSLSRLRIAGFKSFAEPVTVEILPGLTGVIGPNGCGKSNVVEALRWAMGESNARSLRGGEMDDVIFAGTANRPSRNVCEVVVSLDDPGTAEGEPPSFPSPFQDHKDLQISRRIERAIARDLQTAAPATDRTHAVAPRIIRARFRCPSRAPWSVHRAPTKNLSSPHALH